MFVVYSTSCIEKEVVTKKIRSNKRKPHSIIQFKPTSMYSALISVCVCFMSKNKLFSVFFFVCYTHSSYNRKDDTYCLYQMIHKVNYNVSNLSIELIKTHSVRQQLIKWDSSVGGSCNVVVVLYNREMHSTCTTRYTRESP